MVRGGLAVAVLVGIVAFAFSSMIVLAAMSWQDTKSLHELIDRVLILLIGIELIRTLVKHDLGAVTELLAFVVAREMLKPDLSLLDALLGVSAFAVLLAARRFCLRVL